MLDFRAKLSWKKQKLIWKKATLNSKQRWKKLPTARLRPNAKSKFWRIKLLKQTLDSQTMSTKSLNCQAPRQSSKRNWKGHLLNWRKLSRGVRLQKGQRHCWSHRWQKFRWDGRRFGEWALPKRNPLPLQTWSVIGRRNSRWRKTNNTPNPDNKRGYRSIYRTKNWVRIRQERRTDLIFLLAWTTCIGFLFCFVIWDGYGVFFFFFF